MYQGERATRTCIYIIDEAQQIETQGLPLILNQARSLKIGCVLAHQSLDQLKLNSDHDLTQIVLSSTAFKQVFRASDLLTRDYLTRSGGEAVYHRLNWDQPADVRRGMLQAESIRSEAALRTVPWTGNPIVPVVEEIRARLEPNTIMEVSADPNLSLVNFTEDQGPVQYHAAWTTVISGFHIDRDKYEKRMKLTWPPADGADGTIVVPQNWKPGPSPPSAAPSPPPASNPQQRVQQALDRLRKQNGG